MVGYKELTLHITWRDHPNHETSRKVFWVDEKMEVAKCKGTEETSAATYLELGQSFP